MGEGGKGSVVDVSVLSLSLGSSAMAWPSLPPPANRRLNRAQSRPHAQDAIGQNLVCPVLGPSFLSSRSLSFFLLCPRYPPVPSFASPPGNSLALPDSSSSRARNSF